MNKLILLLVLFTSYAAQAPSFRPLFIIWNVGQGQWITSVELDGCYHFDFGGERLPLTQVKRLCLHRNNHLLLSHWDYDHWGGLKKIIRFLSPLCHNPWPQLLSNKKTPSLIDRIPLCKNSPAPFFQPPRLPDSTKKFRSNDLSQVHIFQNQILIPGDSTTAMEEIWAANKGALSQITILILGHHGSHTSTSETLLNSLPSLRMAIASARQLRYGHPHPKIQRRLRQHHIALLRTEDWGHIGIEY